MNPNSENYIKELSESLLDENVISWLKKKGQELKDKAIDFKKAGVREGYEIVLAARILLNIIKKKGATPEEIKFLKSQSADMAKIVALLGLQAIPGNNAMILFLDKLFEKSNIPFSFYPSSHKDSKNVETLKKAYPEKDLFESMKIRLNEINQRLDEISWDDDFKDVKKSCITHESLVRYLNKVRANAFVEKYKDREKFSKNKPFIHAKSSFFEKGKQQVDVDDFIKQITAKPNTVVNTTDKMLKSGGPDEYVYKTGVPAFRGLVYDKNTDEFFIVNTCPGAGSCVLICYALKGNYIRYNNSYDLMTRRLN